MCETIAPGAPRWRHPRRTPGRRDPLRLVVPLLVMALGACSESAPDRTTTLPATTPTTVAVETPTTVTGAASSTTPVRATEPPPTASPPATEPPATSLPAAADPTTLTIETFPVPAGSHPHDVAPAADGGVWYTAQHTGELGWLDPETGETRHFDLGAGSQPHGVIVDGAGAPWITDGGLNAIVTMDPATEEVTVFPLPADRPGANLNTATFDGDGVLWFTGQSGVYGSLVPSTGAMEVYDAPRGRGPYGIATTPDGSVFFASLAGSYIGAIAANGSVAVVEPPTGGQGARRVWSDSTGAIWVSEWNTGHLSRYRPGTDEWHSWELPGDDPATYSVYVDETDIVWATDFGSNSIVRFDPHIEEFTMYPLPHDPGAVRQMLGRPGEVWGAESGADHLVLIRTRVE